MRYEEIGGLFEGWTYDERGTIHTPSGYRTTPQQIEGMLWLFGCLPFRPEKLLMHSDEAPGALRPLLELSDLDDTGQTPPTRYRHVDEKRRSDQPSGSQKSESAG